MSAVPATTDADTVFNPPPGWAAPAGFDPRRGHLPDPAWPAAPAGWQFWVTRPRPHGLVAALRRGWWGPVLATVVVATLAVVLNVTGSTSPADGVGSCWARGTGDRLTPVDCSSSSAAYRVSSVVAKPAACGSASPGYLDGPDGVECLAVMP